MVANRGIESGLGTEAIGKFRDIVTKVFARRHTGNSLGQRGPERGQRLEASRSSISLSAEKVPQ